jgi:uncharacterized membrane protein
MPPNIAFGMSRLLITTLHAQMGGWLNTCYLKSVLQSMKTIQYSLKMNLVTEAPTVNNNSHHQNKLTIKRLQYEVTNF